MQFIEPSAILALFDYGVTTKLEIINQRYPINTSHEKTIILIDLDRRGKKVYRSGVMTTSNRHGPTPMVLYHKVCCVRFTISQLPWQPCKDGG